MISETEADRHLAEQRERNLRCSEQTTAREIESARQLMRAAFDGYSPEYIAYLPTDITNPVFIPAPLYIAQAVALAAKGIWL